MTHLNVPADAIPPRACQVEVILLPSAAQWFVESHLVWECELWAACR